MTALAGARVVVTGGAGTIGSHLVDAAIAEGAREVVALDAMVRGVPENLAGALATGRARLVGVDIRDREAVRANIEGADVVFHQAALRWTRCQENPRECQEVMVRWLDLIDQGKPLVIFGDGSASTDFVYVGDAVRANVLACVSDARAAIVNVCSGIESRMKDVAELLLEITGSGVGIELRPQPAGALPARRYGDPRRAEAVLGFRATTTLREGLTRLIDWRRRALGANELRAEAAQ